MREIKFRGMNIKGNWYYGNLSILKQDINSVKAGYYISNSVGLPFAYEARPETVGQFTGLLDKNGKEIYEGDIIESIWNSKKYSVEWNEKEGEWYFCPDCNEDTKYKGTIIIGNIYENPELLTNSI